MSAPVQVDLSHELSGTNVLSWSEDYNLAVATTKCVYLIGFICNPAELHSSFLLSKSTLAIPAVALEFDVGIDRKILHQYNTKASSAFMQSLMLDRTLSPAFVGAPSYNAYKVVRWSPAGCDTNGRCILACLTRDHRLTVYRISSRMNNLVKVSEPSDILYQHMKNCQYSFHGNKDQFTFDSTDEKEIYLELKRRYYGLAATDMCWSGIFINELHSKEMDVSPNPKISQSDTAPDRYILLAVVMKSSDVVLWKFHLPVTDNASENPSLIGAFATGYSIISSAAWCKTTPSNKQHGWLALGDKEGSIAIWKVDSSGKQSPIANKCLEVWSEKDLMSVEQLAWGHTNPGNTQTSKPLLIAAKGTYTMVFMLNITEQDVSLVHKTHISGHHAVSITGLDVLDNVSVSCSTDGCVKKTVITETSNGLNIDSDLLDSSKPLQHRQCGIALSPGQQYIALITELCRSGKAGERAVSLVVKPLRSDTEAEAYLLNSDGLLFTKIDSVEFFRQIIVANYTLTKELEALTGDYFWQNEEFRNCLYKLKLRRFLLKMKLASVQHTVSQKTRGKLIPDNSEFQVLLDSTTNEIDRTEKQLVFLHAQKALKAWKSNETGQPESCNHPNMCSLLIMVDIQGKMAPEQGLDLGVFNEIYERYIGHESTEGVREQCVLCSGTFTSVNHDTCSNGHKWPLRPRAVHFDHELLDKTDSTKLSYHPHVFPVTSLLMVLAKTHTGN